MNTGTTRKHDERLVARAFELNRSMSYGKVAEQLTAEFKIKVGKTTVSQWVTGVTQADAASELIEQHRPFTPTPATHCKRGHEYKGTPGNRTCHVCHNAARRKRRRANKIH